MNNLSKYIDHTLLKQDATKSQIDKLISEALEHHFFSVCVNPIWVNYCYEKLQNSEVKICSVIGFPLGSSTTSIKIAEATQAIQNGANEIDMVINIGWLKDKKNQDIINEIRQIKKSIGSNVLKVIIETCLLTKEEIINASNLIVEAGGDFVKTSTGFSTAGANFEDVKLILNTVNGKAKVKASGGIKNQDQLVKYIEIGVSRIGTSSGVSLISNQTNTTNY